VEARRPSRVLVRPRRCVYNRGGKHRNRFSPIVPNSFGAGKIGTSAVFAECAEPVRRRIPIPRSMAESEARLTSTRRSRRSALAQIPRACHSIRAFHRTQMGESPGSVANVANPASNTTNVKLQTKTIACGYGLVTVECYLCNTRPKKRCSSLICAVPLLRV
jgi:hypothetical protein